MFRLREMVGEEGMPSESVGRGGEGRFASSFVTYPPTSLGWGGDDRRPEVRSLRVLWSSSDFLPILLI